VVSVDFISELPEAHGHDAILVTVDSVGKRAHFIPTYSTCSAIGAANLYRKNVWKLHGLLDAFLSDRGPQFIAEFTRELHRLLGIKMLTSTAYHPQTDGQTERVNQELEQYLRLFCNERQDDWDELLPEAEFAYNNHVHASTQSTPFLLDTGCNPRMGFEPRQRPTRNESVQEFVDRMKAAEDEAKSALAKAKDDMAKYYNRHRNPAPEYHPGDKVFLEASDISTTRPSKKLSHKYLGPFPIERRVGPLAYRLRLPHSMKRIHPVFHVIKLSPAITDPIAGQCRKPPPPPVVVHNEEEWEVQEILDSRIFRKRLEYKVLWKGYDYADATWEPKQNCAHAPDLIAEFHAQHPDAPRQIRGLLHIILPPNKNPEATMSSRHGLEGGVM